MTDTDTTDTTENADAVCAALGLSAAELNALFTADPVDGFLGTTVAAGLRRRFGLTDDTEPLGSALVAAGVLTAAEGEWLDDLD